jgi:hypothetical protein
LKAGADRSVVVECKTQAATYTRAEAVGGETLKRWAKDDNGGVLDFGREVENPCGVSGCLD